MSGEWAACKSSPGQEVLLSVLGVSYNLVRLAYKSLASLGHPGLPILHPKLQSILGSSAAGNSHIIACQDRASGTGGVPGICIWNEYTRKTSPTKDPAYASIPVSLY